MSWFESNGFLTEPWVDSNQVFQKVFESSVELIQFLKEALELWVEFMHFIGNLLNGLALNKQYSHRRISHSYRFGIGNSIWTQFKRSQFLACVQLRVELWIDSKSACLLSHVFNRSSTWGNPVSHVLISLNSWESRRSHEWNWVKTSFVRWFDSIQPKLSRTYPGLFVRNTCWIRDDSVVYP